MKYSIWTLAFLFLIGASLALADSLYINDMTKINLRSGKGTEFRIISMLDTGQQVEVKEQSDGWALVRTKDGKEGWLFARMLTDQMPCSATLAGVQAELARAKTEMVALSEENVRLKEENTRLTAESGQNSQTADKLKTDYESLKNESTDFLSMKQKLEAAQREADRQKNIALSADAELNDLRRDDNWRWFLSGAAVLLCGIVLGMISKRRRSGSLLR